MKEGRAMRSALVRQITPPKLVDYPPESVGLLIGETTEQIENLFQKASAKLRTLSPCP
jgi:hypothetical protein